MNTKASYKGFKSTKWDNKTDSQKVKTLKNQYEKLGFKIPKYLQNQKINDKQFLSALNRIEKTYQRRIEKEQPTVKYSDIQYEVNKYNTLVEKRLKQFQKQGFSNKALDYLKGNMTFITLGDRAYFSNNTLLEKIDLGYFKANKEGRKTTLDIIKANYNKLKDNNYVNNILDSNKNVPILEEFLNSETFNNLDDSTKKHILQKFKNLNIVQQEVLIQNTLNGLREKYEDIDELDYTYAYNVGASISRAIDDIVKEI